MRRVRLSIFPLALKSLDHPHLRYKREASRIESASSNTAKPLANRKVR
jgi:hypothetical protein